jgi:hypothetical protein
VADQPLFLRSDAELEAALRDLSSSVAWPVAERPTGGGRDIAAAVRARIESGPPPRLRSWTWRPARRALVLAVAILLALTVVAAATGFGLPGLRLIFGPPPASISPPPSLEPSRSPAAGPPGASMRLGRLVDLADLDAEAGFAVTWPDDSSLGPPDAAYIDDFRRGQVNLVWASRPGLPDTLEPGVGLLMSAFRGTVDSGTINKIVSGGATAHTVTVNGERGWWVSGDPHFFFYEGPNGIVSDERRWVGDVLLWADDRLTYRLETSLGQDAAVELAESMP